MQKGDEILLLRLKHALCSHRNWALGCPPQTDLRRQKFSARSLGGRQPSVSAGFLREHSRTQFLAKGKQHHLHACQGGWARRSKKYHLHRELGRRSEWQKNGWYPSQRAKGSWLDRPVQYRSRESDELYDWQKGCALLVGVRCNSRGQAGQPKPSRPSADCRVKHPQRKSWLKIGRVKTRVLECNKLPLPYHVRLRDIIQKWRQRHCNDW